MGYSESKIVIGLILLVIGLFVFLRSFSGARKMQSQMKKAAENNDRGSFDMFQQMRTKLRGRAWIGIALILVALFFMAS